MVADVLEVPVGADDRGARRPSTPGSSKAPSVGPEARRRLVGHVREGEALGGEADPRAFGRRERPAIAADAVVVARRPASGRNGRSPPVGVDGTRPRRARRRSTGAGHLSRRTGRGRASGSQAEHRRPAARSRCCRRRRPGSAAGEPLEEGVDLAATRRAELGVRERVVEVREREVLPDEDPELVAQVVEPAVLVERRCPGSGACSCPRRGPAPGSPGGRARRR